jgi:hypothetical protein
MLRKIGLALVTAAALGTAALAPTSASAWGGGWHGYGFRSFSYDRSYDSYDSHNSYNYESDFSFRRSDRRW